MATITCLRVVTAGLIGFVAWSGALLITFTVLALNIGSRVLGAERSAK